MTKHPAKQHPQLPNEAGSRAQVWLVCLLLATAVFAVFGKTVSYEFVNLDDRENVYENPNVVGGLTMPNVVHAFAASNLGNWDPLTTLSHLLDCEFYGLHPAGHHFTNVLLHAATAILLFLLLRRLTVALWPSAFAAAAFAIHPLRAESVAWVTERKDVLSGFFFMLTLLAYVRYVRRPVARAYLAVMACFALALMSKSMVVTLPVILLVLDWWPLKRIARAASNAGGASVFRGLSVEKLPLFALSALAAVATLLAQSHAHAVQSLDTFSLPMRLSNAVVACATYIGKTFWPTGLAAYYPLPTNGWNSGKIAACGLLLIGISAVAVRWRRERPYGLAGWLWFLVMLLPVIGLVQVGGQAWADRYTYLPQIGLCIALAWLAAGVAKRQPSLRPVLGFAAVAAIAALAACASVQTTCWRDSGTLWSRTLKCTTNNAFANYNYGTALAQKGNLNDAMEQFQRAVEIRPDYADARNNLGYTLMEKGRFSDALTNLQIAVTLEPKFAEAHNNLGRALATFGRLDEAAKQFEDALRDKPGFADANFNYGNLLAKVGQTNQALARYDQALAQRPNHAGAHNNLAGLLLREGKVDEAIPHLQRALELRPDLAEARENLNTAAWTLATSADPAKRDGPRAVALAGQLVKLSNGTDPVYLATLAAAEAEAGQFAEAVTNVGEARRLATQDGDLANAALLEAQMHLYQSHKPYRDTNALTEP